MAVLLVVEAVAQSASADRAVAGTVTSSAMGAAPKSTNSDKKDPAILLSVFEVTGEKDEGYKSTQTVSGSSTVENLRDVPNQISIMNRDLIDDLMATTITELTAYAITGESDPNPETPQAAMFRGMRTGQPGRNGVQAPSASIDTFSTDRVEFLRGPIGFLYGGGNAGGGFLNNLTKQAQWKDFINVSLLFGSHALRRFEIDANRRITDKVAIRAGFAYHDARSFVHHVSREFKGLYLAAGYKPFARTKITLSLEKGLIDEVRQFRILTDVFSTTVRTGATIAYATNTGGYTLFAGSGKIYNTVNANSRRSQGTNTFTLLTDQVIMPKEMNFLGPDGYYKQAYYIYNGAVEQQVGGNFAVQLAFTSRKIAYDFNGVSGSSSAGAYLDTDRNLPDGSVNPNYNQYYTESVRRLLHQTDPLNDAHVSAAYNLKLPFTTQRIVALGMVRDFTPDSNNYSEIVDPRSAFFSGTLIGANTLAAHQANVTTFQRNYFYRRYYIRDGDGGDITGRRNTVPGVSVLAWDPAANGGAAGRLSNRYFRTPAYGFGSSGSFLDGRVRTLAGWQKGWFIQDPRQYYYNPISGNLFELPTTPANHVVASQSTYNIGGVLRFSDLVSPFANYATSVGLQQGFGPASLRAGDVRGLLATDGYDVGLRWSFMGGRLESNWTYYVTNLTNTNSTPAIPAVVRPELAVFADIDPTGIDSQDTRATGLEFETIANFTNNWKLTWNFSTNQLATANTFPILRGLQTTAKGQNTPTPQLDAFLGTVVEGTPIGGFTKVRSNLVTRYRFAEGPLRGAQIGGGFRYRDASFLGNLDLDRDGIAEKQWAPGYILWDISFGHQRQIMKHKVDFGLNINNVFDKNYYSTSGLTLGLWGEGRSYRFSIRTQF